MSDNDFNAVLFSRVGDLGLIPFIGALWASEETNILDRVRVWIAPSTTSFVAVMKFLGFTSFEIMMFIYEFPKLKLSPTPHKNPIDLGGSLVDIKASLAMKIIAKLGYIPTLEELYIKKGIIFVAIGFSLLRQETEYIHRDTYPKISLLDAIMISLATPGNYRPYKLGEDLWIDGSIIEPWSPNSIDLVNGNILGITTKRTRVPMTSKDPIGQTVNIMRATHEASRIITLSANMTLIEIDVKGNTEAFQLRDGYEAFNKVFDIPREENKSSNNILIKKDKNKEDKDKVNNINNSEENSIKDTEKVEVDISEGMENNCKNDNIAKLDRDAELQC